MKNPIDDRYERSEKGRARHRRYDEKRRGTIHRQTYMALYQMNWERRRRAAEADAE